MGEKERISMTPVRFTESESKRVRKNLFDIEVSFQQFAKDCIEACGLNLPVDEFRKMSNGEREKRMLEIALKINEKMDKL